MANARAVLLDLGDAGFAAVAPEEMVEVLVEGSMVEVPLAPPHCHELMHWRGKMLPVFDLARWQAPAAAQGGFLAVVAYRPAPGEPLEHGCLRLATFPNLVAVDDGQACALPGEAWSAIASSCFLESAAPVPILRLGAVFDGGK